MRVRRGLVDGQYRAQAGISARGRLDPLRAVSRAENRGETFPHFRPGAAVVLRGQRLIGQSQGSQQGLVELRLYRTDGDELAIQRLVGSVIGCTAVDHIAAALRAPAAELAERLKRRHQVGHAVEHGGVDHLAAPGVLHLECRREYSDGEVECATAQIRHHANAIQRAAHREVVDVVAGFLGERPVLTPSGHPPIDQTGVRLETDLWSQPQSFGDARAKSFDQRVGARQQLQQRTHRGRLLQIQRDRSLVAIVEVEARRQIRRHFGARNSVDAHYISAEVGQQRAGEGPWPDRTQLHDPETLQWSAHAPLPVRA